MRKIKIWHIVLIYSLLIIIFNLSFLIDVFQFSLNYVRLIFTDFNRAYNELNFKVFDILLSFSLFVVLLILIALSRKTSIFLNYKINFPVFMLTSLFYLMLFAPLIDSENPDFQKDIKVTKLLKPFSSVNEIHLINNESTEDEFDEIKQRVIKPPFDESVIFADDYKLEDSALVYTQRNISKLIPLSSVQLMDGIPFVTKRTYLLGTDEYGRDILTRLLYGARVSLLIGMGSVFVSLFIGLSLGFIAGMKEGIIDVLLNRLTELFLSFPVIYLVILILALFSNSLLSVIVVLGISGWMSLFKIVRTEVISAKEKYFIYTAKMIGLSNRKILLNEILPIVFIPLTVNLIFQFSNVILAESALSFLGLGVGNSYPSWGAMIEAGQQYMEKAWWMILFPGLALIFTLFAINSLGNKLKVELNPSVK